MLLKIEIYILVTIRIAIYRNTGLAYRNIIRLFNISLYNTEIYLDEYTALMSVLDEPLGESNTDIKAVYESKYISVLYSEMLNDLFILYLDIFFFQI